MNSIVGLMNSVVGPVNSVVGPVNSAWSVHFVSCTVNPCDVTVHTRWREREREKEKKNVQHKRVSNPHYNHKLRNIEDNHKVEKPQNREKRLPTIKAIKHKQVPYRHFRGCLVCVFKQQFLVFKQHFTHFNTLFHPHVFS